MFLPMSPRDVVSPPECPRAPSATWRPLWGTPRVPSRTRCPLWGASRVPSTTLCPFPCRSRDRLSPRGCLPSPLRSGTPRGCPVPFSLPSVPLCPFVPSCPGGPSRAVQSPALLPVMSPVIPGPCRARAGVAAPGTPWAVRGSLPPARGCYQPHEGWPGCDKGQQRAELWDGAALGCSICPQHPTAPGIVLPGVSGWKRSFWGGQRAGSASLSLPPLEKGFGSLLFGAELLAQF